MAEINLLIFGEKGAGKTTFIHSFINYLKYDTISNAIDGGLIKVKQRNLENTSLFGPRPYVFLHNKRKYRLIDTPGINPEQSDEENNANLEKTLLYIQQYQTIHAFCFLFNTNSKELSIQFINALKKIYDRLGNQSAACANAVHIFTHSRSTYYKEGELAVQVKKSLKTVDEHNTFFIDNEIFKYAETTNKLSHDDIEQFGFTGNWKASQSACTALNNRLLNLEPYTLQPTSHNAAVYAILTLFQPLVDALELIADNVYIQKSMQASLEFIDFGINECTSATMFLKVEQLLHPVTVCIACASEQEEEKDDDDDMNSINKKYNYQECIDPSLYLNNVPNRIMIDCAETVLGDICTACNCEMQSHMTLFYKTKFIQQATTETIELTSEEDIIRHKYEQSQNTQSNIDDYQEEITEIINVIGEFLKYLKLHYCTYYPRIFTDYFSHLIARENNCDEADEWLLYRYKMFMHEFNKMGIDASSKDTVLSPKNVFGFLKKLYELQHFGEKIKELHNIQQTALVTALKRKEYFYRDSAKEEVTVKSEVKPEAMEEKIARLFKENNYQIATAILMKELQIKKWVDFKTMDAQMIQDMAYKYFDQYKKRKMKAKQSQMKEPQMPSQPPAYDEIFPLAAGLEQNLHISASNSSLNSIDSKRGRGYQRGRGPNCGRGGNRGNFTTRNNSDRKPFVQQPRPEPAPKTPNPMYMELMKGQRVLQEQINQQQQQLNTHQNHLQRGAVRKQFVDRPGNKTGRSSSSSNRGRRNPNTFVRNKQPNANRRQPHNIQPNANRRQPHNIQPNANRRQPHNIQYTYTQHQQQLPSECRIS